jgi:2-polyprenyl-3-methyl-5-hydroxy-6-metoxy-1,4-benzoquinol methylase
LNRNKSRTDDEINLASALEEYAHEYRLNAGSSHFLKARWIVMSYLLEHLRDNSSVIDVNCGTGIDAVILASRGHSVNGIDISSTMIEYARQNISEADVADLAKVEVGDYRTIGPSPRTYGAVLSNFGGVNFCKDLSEFFRSVAGTLQPGGLLVVNSVGHFSLSEFLIFLTRGKVGKALRRTFGGKARIGGREVEIYYHTKGALTERGKDFGFTLEDVFGLCVFTPPLWADDFYANHTKLAKFLEHIDDFARHMPLLRTGGDFTVYVFRKT